MTALQTQSTKPSKMVKCSDIEGYDTLEKLALDLRWSWSHGGDAIWKTLDPGLWELTHNAWAILQTVSKEKLEASFANPAFKKLVNSLAQSNQQQYESAAWFQEAHPNSALSCVAYFSMEFMLSEALPIYSGGLGNVAGDQLKAASDLGVPVVGVGLLYQQGYFRQLIAKDGTQQALYPYNDPGQLPVQPLRKPNGEWLRLEVSLPGWSLWIRAWEVQVGRVKLYLLDSNDPANFPAHRGITSELYGGGTELRLKQELLLGIGGWRLLEAVGLKPEICHLNEGHAAFAVLERARSRMQESKQPFEEALATTRAGNLFTTHTAVPAGFDLFSPALMEQYLGHYAQDKLNIKLKDLLALGRINPNDDNEAFNMAYLAMRGSGAVNGVSRLHGEVSRHIFESLFPRWPRNEVPVGYVTNGVHMPTWDSAVADDIWSTACGKSRWLGTTEDLEKQIRDTPETRLWSMRNESRKALIEFSRKCLAQQLAARGHTQEDVEHATHLFDPNTLTMCFARRFATYKRPNMLLQDPERLLRILGNPHRPVQLILAGKAHPADKPGLALIQEWMRFIARPEARSHVIFLSDYDLRLTEQLVQGADLWLNTPRRPWEACGTSGMKVLVNGGLNLSELDGWWAEAYTPEVGWALGDGQERSGDPYAYDAVEAGALYDLLEREVIPAFYNRDSNGLPTAWLAKVRESMARLTPQYSANRSVREYCESYYLPGATTFRQRTKQESAGKILDWRRALNGHWQALRFGEMTITSDANQHRFELQVYLDDLKPEFVKVELYADGLHGDNLERIEMTRQRSLAGSQGLYFYSASVPAQRPAADYSARVVPFLKDVAVPLEDSRILWQR